MTKIVEFSALHKTPLTFINNHPACRVNVSIGDALIATAFVIDTGADISMIPLYLVHSLPLEKYTIVENYDCGGIGGSVLGRIIATNVLSVANYSAEKPYVFIPYDINWTIPILGFDMLRGIHPFIDTKEKAVWFTRIKEAGVTVIPSINLELKCEVFVTGQEYPALANWT